MVGVNPDVAAVDDPPVAEAKSWVEGRTFPATTPLIDLSQAVPGHAPPDDLRAHLAELVQRPDTATYAPAAGLPHVRAATAAHLGVAADHTMITAGCNQAFCLAIGALAGPGDNVILPVPHYFNHDMWLRACGIEPRAEPRVDARTRAVVLVTPNNPTGAIAGPAEIAERYEFARRHGIALILDETYKDFRATTAPPHELFSRPDWPGTLVHLFSFSKVFSLAGYRVGSLTAHPDLLREAVKLADCQTIGAPRLAQEAAAYGLAHLGDWVEANRVEMNARVDAFRAAIAATPYELLSAGAYFAYARHPFEEPARAVARRLADDRNVLCIPGECFGPGQERHLRIAFGNATREQIRDVGTRLSR
jgi:aspartate/methionine/tyrosine aminotransferase